MLGITRGHAHLLMSRGRDQLTASVGALLVARTGRDECATLDRLLSGWDGELTVLLRKRLSRHIEHCDICSDRRRRELQPALLSLWPAGVLAAEALGKHAMHATAVPADLKARVLAATTGKDATAAAKAAGLTGGGRGIRGARLPQTRGRAPDRAEPRHALASHPVDRGRHRGGGRRRRGVRGNAHAQRPRRTTRIALGLGGTVTSAGPGPGGAAPPGSPGAQGPGSDHRAPEARVAARAPAARMAAVLAVAVVVAVAA